MVWDGDGSTDLWLLRPHTMEGAGIKQGNVIYIPLPLHRTVWCPCKELSRARVKSRKYVRREEDKREDPKVLKCLSMCRCKISLGDGVVLSYGISQ